jgi:hypothetical protein
VRERPIEFLRYAWASPNSLLGLALGALMIILGAETRAVGGVLEISGGALGAFFRAPAVRCPFHAVTFGHVVLGTDRATLDVARAHERVHVRQYEQWGPAFLPAYVASSLWQLACGRRCYRDNWFERQAHDRS